jgi:hypothetical protein
MAGILAWFTRAFGGIFKLWGVAASQRGTLVLLYVGLYSATVVALAAAINSLFKTIHATAPTDSFLSAGLSLIPANSSLYIGALGTAYAASQLYIWKQRLLKIKVTTK